jgi:hypothetical protein
MIIPSYSFLGIDFVCLTFNTSILPVFGYVYSAVQFSLEVTHFDDCLAADLPLNQFFLEAEASYLSGSRSATQSIFFGTL